MVDGWSFNPPPHWPRPPQGWVPLPSWEPDAEWGPVPPGWQLWVPTPSSRHSWPGVLGGTGVVVLTLAAMAWLPRLADAALVPENLRGADRVAPVEGPGPVGTLTPVAVVPTAPQLTRDTAPRFKSCHALTEVYPHGVGMPDALDRSSPGFWPVTDFGRSTALYGANQALDPDRDQIACER